jgi:hypothetical protein
VTKIEAMNIASQCRATATSTLARNILVDGGGGFLTELLLDAAKAVQMLAESAEQEPVAWMVMNGVCNYQLCWSKKQADALCAEMQKQHDLSGSLAAFHVAPLYTAPQPRRNVTYVCPACHFSLERQE